MAEMAAQKKPVVQLTGTDGNVFALIGVCAKALRKAGLATEATEMTNRVFKSGSYDAALAIMTEYVDAR